MAAEITVGLVRTPIGPCDDWDTFWSSGRAAANWSAGTDLFVYLESVSTCVLERHALEAVPAAPVDSFEGRIFNEQAELRWRRTERHFVGAVITEGDSKLNVLSASREYFLIGIETEDSGKFREGRYPGKLFDYPVQSGGVGKRRAYISVTEYRSAEPDWSVVDRSVDEIEKLLDEPLLIEHRFTGIGIK